MPSINISVTGETTSSATGEISDPVILEKLSEVVQHLRDRSFIDPAPEPEQVPAPGGAA